MGFWFGSRVRCTLKYIPFIKSCFLELKKCGWLGEREDSPLSLFGENEIAVLTFLGGELYGILIQDASGETVHVDQFITFRMAQDIARAFKNEYV